ncbi:uncharacterized protein LOC133199900 [Saccostrea echinata]|uniref:uncharacterized protein LOC133199900 n=1 Tax=Saccostrea echinata TaxID=191078 RepID=UPI002A835C78|nr:uncharacterized protein LOC133199900 [Saccostrea echinata]
MSQSTSKGTGQHYVECAICYNYSGFYCNTCHQRMCEQCRDNHLKERVHRKHEVVLYQDRIKELPSEKCSVHPTRVLELFCSDCQVPICSKCFTTDHNGHQVRDLELVYNESLQQSQKELIKIRDNVFPQSVENLKCQRERVEDIRKKIAQTRLSMKKSADEIKVTLDTILADNNAKLDTMEKFILDEMEEQEKKSEDYISYLQKLIKDYDREMLSSKPSDVIKFCKEMANVPILKIPEAHQPVSIEFTKGTIRKAEIEKQFGKISQSKQKIQKREEKESVQITLPPVSTTVSQTTGKIAINVKKEKEINIRSQLSSLCYLSPSPFQKFWASDDKGNLIQADMQGNILQKISTNSNNNGYHTMTSEGELLYTDTVHRAIYRVSSAKKTTTFLTTADWGPYSIHSSRLNGDILVGMMKGNTCKFTRYSKEGEKLQDLQSYQRKNKKQNSPQLHGIDDVSYIKFITENINGDICIVNNRKVEGMTQSGERRFSYTGRSQYAFSPTGICTDILGHILVCSFSNVHLLNADGQFVALLFDPDQCPRNLYALCTDDQQDLWIGSQNNLYNSTVYVYRYLQL